MDTKQLGVLAGIVGVLGLIVQHVPSYLLGRWIDGGFEGALPMMGTAGQTVVTYNLLVNIMTPFVVFALAVGLGYYVGQQVDMADEYRRVVGVIAIGSAVGGALAGTPFMLQGSITEGTSTFLLLTSFVAMVAPVLLTITIGALAGGAISHFQTADDSPPGPTKAGTDSQTGSQSASIK